MLTLDIHTYINMCRLMDVCACTHMYIDTYTQIFMPVCLHIYIYIHGCLPSGKHISMHIIYVCAFIHMYEYMHKNI